MGVFNEQRTGKTPTSIMVMESRGVDKLLIVCPASLIYKWAAEYTEWTGKTAHVVTSAKKFEKFKWETGAIVINYENLRDNGSRKGAAHTIIKMKPQGIIVDEAHRIKDRRSANAKAIFKFRRTPFRLLLTGTPAPNKAYDIWSLLHFLDPDMFSSYWRFIEEYFYQETKYFGGHTINEPTILKPGKREDLQNILNTVSTSRKRKEVMPWLPKEERPTVIKLPCTPAQKKYLKELEETFRTEHINTQSVLERLVRVRQICSAPAILELRGRSPKIDWLKQYLKDYPEKSAIVFSNSTKLLRLVCGEVCAKMIIGDTPAKQRQEHINKFQEGKEKVLLIQTQAGKEGLTLDMADVTIFLDTYPPAADYQQAKDRMVATSPERVKPQEIIHLMIEDTYDARLYNLVAQGIAETDVINDYKKYIKEARHVK